MSNPFAVSPSASVIQDPGAGGAIVQGIAGVLAAQQQARENAFRAQQLAQQQEQQQALAQYYQGTIGVQNRQEDRLDSTASAERAGRAQIGGAVRRAIGGSPVAMPSLNTSVAPSSVGALEVAAPGPDGEGLFQQILSGAAGALDPHMAAVFGGVSDENLPAAVQEVQKLQPQAPELPTSGKEYGYYQRLLAVDPQRAAEYRRLFLDPKPSTVINNIPAQGESEFSKELAKAQVAALTKGENEARTSIQAFPAMNEAYGLVGKSFTGWGANQLLGLARVAGAAGFKPSKDRVADSQTLLKLTRDQTLAYLQTRALGSGTAVSDRDREFMERQSAADLTLDPASIKRIIRINVGSGVMRMQEAVNDLRDQALAYPKNAPQLNAKALKLERQVAPIRMRYSEMLKAEDASEEDLRGRMGQTPGISLPGQP